MIGEEASLDEASRPELAVIKRFALATSLRIEEIVSLSWPQVDFPQGRRPSRRPASPPWANFGHSRSGLLEPIGCDLELVWNFKFARAREAKFARAIRTRM